MLVLFDFLLHFSVGFQFPKPQTNAPIKRYAATRLWDFFALTIRRSSLFHLHNVASIIKLKNTRSLNGRIKRKKIVRLGVLVIFNYFPQNATLAAI